MSGHSRAVVVGASMAGLFSARVLADVVDEVVVLERERLVDRAEPRAHVPQGRHLHALLNAGRVRIEAWFPGIGETLRELGAVEVDGLGGLWYQGGGYRAPVWAGSALAMSRPLLETEVRRRVAALPNVFLEDGILVEGVRVEDHRVTGVRMGGEVRPAELVVDCSGRNSRIAHDLAESGALAPPVSRVNVDCAYATRLFRRSLGGDELPGTFVVVVPDPPRTRRGGVMLPIEGGRWIVGLLGSHGETPPTGDAGWRAYADSLESPVLGAAVARCEPLGPAVAYRFPSSQRRHYEVLHQLLPGLVSVGDVVSSFNPIYGQGMSSAALQAEALGSSLALVTGPTDPRLPGLFQRSAAKVVDTPWTIAVGADFNDPLTTGPRPHLVGLLNRYVKKVGQAAHTSPYVTAQLMNVQNLDAPPAVLMRPRMMFTVLRAARQSPAVTGAQVVHPTVSSTLSRGSVSPG